MRAILLAALLAVAGCQLQEPTLLGTVVQVVEIEQPEESDESGRSYEPPLVPEVAWQVDVRLDDGSAVTVTHEGPRRYEPGERVRVLVEEDAALLL